MSQDSEELSEVFEEDEEITIKKIYVSRPIMTLSKKLDQKVLIDDPDVDPNIDFDDSDRQDASEESEHADDDSIKEPTDAKPVNIPTNCLHR